MSNAQDVALLDSPAIPDIPTIVQRYLDGATLIELAHENSKHHRTIYRWLLTENGDNHEALVTEALANRIADADLQIELSHDKCSVARARELAKFARMDFERRRPKLYGAQTQVNSNMAIQVIIQRDTPQQIVVDVAKAEDVA